MSRRRQAAHPCPTALKTAFSSEAYALEALARIVAEEGNPREKLPMRVYLCECHRWHLTSRAESYADIAERMAASDA